jgi:hypothetical protein
VAELLTTASGTDTAGVTVAAAMGPLLELDEARDRVGLASSMGRASSLGMASLDGSELSATVASREGADASFAVEAARGGGGSGGGGGGPSAHEQ